MALDGVENVLVEVTEVLHRRVAAVVAFSLREAIMQRLTAASLGPVDSEKQHEYTHPHIPQPIKGL